MDMKNTFILYFFNLIIIAVDSKKNRLAESEIS